MTNKLLPVAVGRTISKTASAMLIAAFLCSGMNAAPHASKIAQDAAASDALSLIRVIVQWNIPTGAETASKMAALGGKTVKEFSAVRQGVYAIPASELSTLEKDDAVKYVSLDRIVKRKLAVITATVNAPTAWSTGFVGTGVGVAVLDSGINKDDNLGASDKTIVYTDDFTPSAYDSKGRPTSSFGADWYGHGQHIAGIIASNGKASSCARCPAPLFGVAPGSNLIDLKVLDVNGEGSDSQVIAAIDEAIQLKATYNIRVINLSLGRPVTESYTLDPLCQAVEAAWKSGIVVVVAAGNEGRDNSTNNQGYGTVLSPGNDPYVITVGAMKSMGTVDRSDDLIASYSSKGPTAVDHIVKPDLVAPGNLVVSLLAQHGTLPLTNPQNAVTSYSIQGDGALPSQAPKTAVMPANLTAQPPQVNFGAGYSNKYYTLSGTSMATAVVSGSVADILQAYPTMTPDQVKILLMQTASKSFPQSSTVTDDLGNVYTSYYDMFTVGAGYLDLQAAMSAAAKTQTLKNSLSPTSTYDPASGNVYVTFDTQSAWTNPNLWSDKSKWGASAVWSSSVLVANQAIWSSKSKWGASANDASSSLWSDKSKWGASADESSSIMDSATSIQIAGEK